MKKNFTLLIISIVIWVSGYNQPANDICSGATVISAAGPGNSTTCITGTTVGAGSITFPGPICGLYTWPNNVWYTFVSTGVVNTITVQPIGSPAAKKLAVSVYTGSCSALFYDANWCVVAATDSSSDTIIQNSTIGTQYWIEISSLDDTGSFELCINTLGSLPADSIACATATHLCSLDSFTLASSPLNNSTFTPDCFQFSASSSYWYSFTIGETGSLSWSCTPTAANSELDWALYDITNGGCSGIDGNTPIRCNYHFSDFVSAPIGMSDTSTTNCPINSGNNSSWQEFCPSAIVTAGNTYIIFIDDYANNGTGWHFNFTGSTFQTAKASSQFNRAICTGQSYSFNNQTLSQSGTYTDTLQSWQGCDSIVTLNLTLSNVLQTTTSAGICTGDSVIFNGHTYKQTGIYSDTLQATGGCDSIITLNLTVSNIVRTTIHDTMCNAGGFVFNGQTLTQPGTYIDTLQSSAACDSIVTLHLAADSVLHAHILKVICAGNTVDFNGQILSASGIYIDTLPSGDGCDSIVTLHLIVNSVPVATITQSNDTLQTESFDIYQWLLNGAPITGANTQSIVITQTGNYSVVVTSDVGCIDTSAVLNVISMGISDINPAYGVKVFPNPNNGNFVIEFSDNAVKDVSVTNILGQTVSPVTKVTRQAEFDLGALPNGVYILKAADAQNTRQVVFKQVVVQH